MWRVKTTIDGGCQRGRLGKAWNQRVCCRTRCRCSLAGRSLEKRSASSSEYLLLARRGDGSFHGPAGFALHLGEA